MLWSGPGESGDELFAPLRQEVAPALSGLGARRVQVNVDDRAVAEAAATRVQSSRPPPSGTVAVWHDEISTGARSGAVVQSDMVESLTRAVSLCVTRTAGYLVDERIPLPNTRYPPEPGSRTEGFAQLAFIRRPARVERDEWLRIWHDDHTSVAIETQSTFGYVQNTVIGHLADDLPEIDGIVEELFPAAAMADRHAFFDAAGNDDRFRRNAEAMIESSARFLDFDALEVIPTSQYVIEPSRD